MDPSLLFYLLGGTGGIVLLVRQVRIGLRDRGDRQLLRHIFDNDRQARVLESLEKLRQVDRPASTRRASSDATPSDATPSDATPSDVGP